MNDSLLTKTINFLRFPLIVGVVFIHSNILVVNIQGTVIRYDEWPIVSFVINLFSYVFADVCVPLFFFISGFLFFYNSYFTKEVYFHKIRSRIRSLFIPYLIWNFVAFVILLIQVHPKVIHFFPLLKDYRVDIISFLSSFWVTNLPVEMSGNANPINTPLWFIRDLMVLVLMSPVIWWLVKNLKMGLIVILAFVWFFSLGKHIGFPLLCHQSLFFFPLGAYFGIFKLDFAKLLVRRMWSVYLYLGLAVIDAMLNVGPYELFMHNVVVLLGMVAVVCLVSSLLERKKIQVSPFLIGASFFVYALHNLFLGKMTKVFLMIVQPESPFVVLVIYFMMPLLSILLCLGVYMMIIRFIPNVGVILTGGRTGRSEKE